MFKDRLCSCSAWSTIVQLAEFSDVVPRAALLKQVSKSDVLTPGKYLSSNCTVFIFRVSQSVSSVAMLHPMKRHSSFPKHQELLAK